MIDVPSLIDIIHDGLNVLANNDKTYIKYEIKESEESRSLYIYKTLPNEGKLNILRISDHLPTMQDLIRGDSAPRPSPDNNTNVSIDFYVPKKVEYIDKVTGKKKSKIARNRFNNHIGVPSTIPTVEPFTITSYEYFYKNLEQRDEMMIWHSIATWVCCLDPNKVYHDPFAQDETKKAKVETKTADVKIYGDKVEITESKINKHMEKKTITESQLRKVVAESVKNILKESYRNGVFGGQLTVSELISELQKMPQDATVCFYNPRGNEVDTIECVKFEEKSLNFREDYDKVILYSDSKYIPEDKPMFPDDYDKRQENRMWQNAYENMPNN